MRAQEVMKAELKAILSVHDVMPETMDDVAAILHRLKDLNLGPVTLLVVPGRPWQTEQLETLREWVAQGHLIAGHGRFHYTQAKRLKHRIHAALISRNVAEHLDLNEEDIISLMERCAEWFKTQFLPSPSLYVPPAWALGGVRRNALRKLPYSHIEVLRGFIETTTGQLHKTPLVGYEVDTALRAAFVRPWNKWQIRRALKTQIPLRIGLHPYDFSLRLSKDIEQLLSDPRLTPITFASSLFLS